LVKKIFVVDDKTDLLYSVKQGLEEIDSEFEVIGIQSAEKCLEKLRNKELPDIILLDIMMPGMNGWEMFDRLKENDSWKKIPVIFLTARTDKIAKNAGKFLAEDYIEKPFNIEDLRQRIHKVINKK
jgi:DNA-binding response OmpR family regulator